MPSSNFLTIFPDLPGKPVKIADSWTTNDTINVKEGGTEMRMTFVSVNTLQGFETVDGHECAKVTAKEGVFVKSISDGLSEGTVAVTGAQKMTIPMTMATKFETNLVK
ncbi:MAG: hypothetical protein MUC94_18550 [bacterium]|nr:hypothetical protein [bacterium]